MTNTELNLHQLENFAGGGVFAKLDSIKAKNRRVIIPGDMYKPVTPADESRGDMLNRIGLDPGPIG